MDNVKLDDLRQSIRKARHSHSMSAEALADKAKTTQSNVLNFENGKANITINTLANICDVLGLDLIVVANNENRV